MSTSLKRRELGSNDDRYLDIEFYRTYNDGTPSLYQTENRPEAINNWRTVGYDIPNFYARVRRGELLPMTPYWHSVLAGSSSGAFDQTYDAGGTVTHQYVIGNSPRYTGWVITEAELWELLPQYEISYVQEAAARIYSNGHDTLTFLAELADVKRMFVHIGRRLIKLRVSPRNWASGASADWLSARYGWRTLLYDLQDLSKAIQSLNDQQRRTRYSEIAGKTHRSADTSEWEIPTAAYIRRFTRMDEITIGLRGSVVADIEVPMFQFNPLQTGWELIPYSFVLDWFISVGKTLAAWSFLNLTTDYVASAGVSINVKRQMDMVSTDLEPYWTVDAGEQHGVCEGTLVRRVPTKVPLLPRFVVRLNSAKIIDILALLVQRR